MESVAGSKSQKCVDPEGSWEKCRSGVEELTIWIGWLTLIDRDICWYIFIGVAHSPPALRSPLAQARRIFFLILPVLVFGNSSTTSHSRGIMNLDIAGWSWHHLMNASFVIFLPGLTVMKALGLSPHFSSSTAATPHSRISGCVIMTDSSATEEIFSPPESCQQLQLWSVSTYQR